MIMIGSSTAASLKPIVPRGAPTRTRARPSKRPLVFLAEDDADFRRTVSDFLRSAGFDVLSASTGHEMLKLLTAAARCEVSVPDAIVMDIRMPRCSGIDVLGALRLADWKQPVVMITAFGDRELHERAASYGASVVLDKPFDAEDLVGMLDLLLRLAHAQVRRVTHDGDNDEDEDEEQQPEILRSPPSDVQVNSEPIDVRSNVTRF